jgi:hypothetical protein
MMGRHAKTARLIETVRTILEAQNPMTLRQVFYQLVSNQDTENSPAEYHRLGSALVDARKEGLIPWDWIEDRTRRPRTVSMWDDLPDFLQTARRSYRRDVWQDQDVYIEAWLEKDALSGLFEEVLRPYGVTLNVGRGYDGWDSIHGAAERMGTGKNTCILYFGDFDPSGEDMMRSLKERLAFFGCDPEIVKVALAHEDIERYHLPPAFNKMADRRTAKFTALHGEKASVELDALPWLVLKERIVTEIEDRMDLDALTETKAGEMADSARLGTLIDGMK